MKMLTFAVALLALTGLAVLDAPSASAGGCAKTPAQPCSAPAPAPTVQPCAVTTVEPCATPCAPAAQPVRYVQTRACCGPRLPRLPRLNIRWPWCCR